MSQAHRAPRHLCLLLIAVAAVALLAGCSMGDDSPETETPATEAPAATETQVVAETPAGSLPTSAPARNAGVSRGGAMTPVEVVDEVKNAVVTVINEQAVTTRFGTQTTAPVGVGTGFIIDEDGHIVTNWHVVEGGSSFTVVLADGTAVPAELIGQDPRDDLAVVRIDPSVVPDTVPLGDSRDLQVAQPVLAIGSPLGAFGNTVTAGIVSSLDRDQFNTGGFCLAYTDLIQHDAAINPGNSGGPLLNLEGEVVGVNTLGITTLPDGTPVQGISFAVPSDTVKAVVDQLIGQGHISAPYLGIGFRALNPRLAAANNLPVDHGIYVTEVEPAGPADDAGIRPGDTIVSVDGQAIGADTTLASLLLGYEPGDIVDLTVLRGDDEDTVPVTLGEVPPARFEQCRLQTQP